MNIFTLEVNILEIVFFIATQSLGSAEAQLCNHSGSIIGNTPPFGECNRENDSECCVKDNLYPTYTCSPKFSGKNNAVLTINSFQEGGDGGGPAECDNNYHSDALSTGWYKIGGWCLHNIIINGNSRSVSALVVDECDSTMGCDQKHNYQALCSNNMVDAIKDVWEALGVSPDNWGQLDITELDA